MDQGVTATFKAHYTHRFLTFDAVKFWFEEVDKDDIQQILNSHKETLLNKKTYSVQQGWKC
jgi:(2Fe-2S) ferredoxin